MLHQIGTGVLGPVFRTYEPQRDRLVAVKAFKLDIVPEDVARLADALRRLASNQPSHPNIARVIDAGLEGTSAFLAMEYASGESLDVALRHLAPGPLERALPLLLEIARAIDAAWAEGWGHGALHPRDIIVSPGTTDVRVVGFGIVPALESIGARAPVRRPYTSPERASGGSWDIRADVYSLGVIAHELLTGRRPLASGEQDGTLALEIAPEQRVSVRRVLTTALAERPEDRFRSAVAFVEALEAVARGETPVHVSKAHVAPKPEVAAKPEAATKPETVTKPAAAVKPEEPRETPPAAASPPDQARSQPRVWQPPQLDAMRVTPPATPRQKGRTVTPPPADIPLVGKNAEAPDLELRPKVSAEPKPPPTRTTSQPARRTEPPARGTPPAAPGTPHVAPSTVHPAPSIAHPAPSISHAAPSIVHPAPSGVHVRARYPWSAIAAAAVAGIILGGVIGYRLGLGRVQSVVQQVTAGRSAGQSGTDVRVAPETPPASPASPPSRPPGSDARSKVAPAPAAPKPSETAARVADVKGQIVVRSVPPGAMVTIDGRKLGETPVTIRDLALGSHQLQVARPGYAPHSERVTLNTRTPSRTISLQLQPGVQTGRGAAGTVLIDSRPRGARVLIDGRAFGTTPVSIPEVSAGRHTITVELAGHKPFKTQVDVKSGEQARVTATLERGK